MKQIQSESIEKIVQTLPIFQTKILLMHREMNSYIQLLKQNNINVTNAQSLKEIEKVYESITTIQQKNSELINQSTTINELISQLSSINTDLITSYQTNQIILSEQKEYLKNLHKQIISSNNMNISEQKESKQMKETKTENIQKEKTIEEYIKERNETKEKKAKELNISIDELNIIEEWTSKEFGEIIFDTEINDWEEEDSQFDQLVINKEKVMFLIDVKETNCKIGGYINSCINVLFNEDENKGIVSDPNAFVFKLKGKQSIQFPIKKNCSENAFYLYPEDDRLLFKMGLNDIEIYKEYEDSLIFQESNSSFDYKDNSYALVGNKEYVTPKRIIVVQLV